MSVPGQKASGRFCLLGAGQAPEASRARPADSCPPPSPATEEVQQIKTKTLFSYTNGAYRDCLPSKRKVFHDL